MRICLRQYWIIPVCRSCGDPLTETDIAVGRGLCFICDPPWRDGDA